MRLKAIIHGELLYTLWLQRCRAKFDNDPNAFTAVAVHAVATLAIIKALVTIEQARRFRSDDFTDAVGILLVRLNNTPLPP